MNRRTFLGVILAACILLGFAGVNSLQRSIDGGRRSIQLEQDELLLQSGGLIKNLSLEYGPLVGAIYWTRAVQYYGEKHRLHEQSLPVLWPLLDISTTLDPHLLPAYRYGSIFLSDAVPRGAGRPDLAEKLLLRGIEANPEEWRLYQDLGNVYYFDAKDYLKAAKAYEEGSKNPKAMYFMKIMAAKIFAEGDSPETSFFLWRDVYQTSTIPEIKKNAEAHLRILKGDLDLKQINQAADEYEKRTGHRATRVSELVEAGLLSAIPKDLEGFPYVLGEDGKAEVNLNSPMLEERLMFRR
jgi:hypothetical protein